MRRKILKLVIGVVLGIAMSEVALRYMPRTLLPGEFRIVDRAYRGRVKWSEIMVGDRYLGYKFRPQLNFLYPSEGREIPVRTTNYGLGDIGFRDLGTTPPFDAITMGDLLAFCDDVPVDGCWEHHLGQAAGLSVATLGVGGYSTLAEARLLSAHGGTLKPRLVLASVFANDFNDDTDFEEWTRNGTDNFWNWRGEREGRGPLGRWLANHFMTARIVDGVLRTRGPKPYTYKKNGLDFVFQRWWLTPLDAERAHERERRWQLMQKALLDMRATAEHRG